MTTARSLDPVRALAVPSARPLGERLSAGGPSPAEPASSPMELHLFGLHQGLDKPVAVKAGIFLAGPRHELGELIALQQHIHVHKVSRGRPIKEGQHTN